MVEQDQRTVDALDAVAERLAARYGDDDPARGVRIRDRVTEQAQRFTGAAVESFVPILVERAVRQELDDTAVRPT